MSQAEARVYMSNAMELALQGFQTLLQSLESPLHLLDLTTLSHSLGILCGAVRQLCCYGTPLLFRASLSILSSTVLTALSSALKDSSLLFSNFTLSCFSSSLSGFTTYAILLNAGASQGSIFNTLFLILCISLRSSSILIV